jgi:hypothetical protein
MGGCWCTLQPFDPPRLSMPAEVHGYQIDLELHRDHATLTLAGDLDSAATDALRGLLTCIERVPSVVHVCTDAVLGADLDAFDPLLDAAHDRRTRGLPAVRVDSLSDAVRDLFGALRLPMQPPVHLDGAQ